MLKLWLVMVIIKDHTIKPQPHKSLNKKKSKIIHYNSFNMNQVTNTPLQVSLPGGGFVFKSKLSLEISAGTEILKMIVEKDDPNYTIKCPKQNKGVEILNISTGRGTQTPHNFPIIMIWGARKMKSEEDILITVGEVELEDDKAMMFLVAEVKDTVENPDVLDTISQRGIAKWLEVCDMVILEDDRNFPRKLFRDLSRAAEGMVTAVTGPSVKDLTNTPSMLVLAKTIVEQFNIVSLSMCCNLFMRFKYDTMRIMTAIDQDCCLLVTVLTMCSYKWMLFPNVEWKLLGNCSNYQVYWPVLACHSN